MPFTPIVGRQSSHTTPIQSRRASQSTDLQDALNPSTATGLGVDTHVTDTRPSEVSLADVAEGIQSNAANGANVELHESVPPFTGRFFTNYSKAVDLLEAIHRETPLSEQSLQERVRSTLAAARQFLQENSADDNAEALGLEHLGKIHALSKLLQTSGRNANFDTAEGIRSALTGEDAFRGWDEATTTTKLQDLRRQLDLDKASMQGGQNVVVRGYTDLAELGNASLIHNLSIYTGDSASRINTQESNLATQNNANLRFGVTVGVAEGSERRVAIANQREAISNAERLLRLQNNLEGTQTQRLRSQRSDETRGLFNEFFRSALPNVVPVVNAFSRSIMRIINATEDDARRALMQNQSESETDALLLNSMLQHVPADSPIHPFVTQRINYHTARAASYETQNALMSRVAETNNAASQASETRLPDQAGGQQNGDAYQAFGGMLAGLAATVRPYMGA